MRVKRIVSAFLVIAVSAVVFCLNVSAARITRLIGTPFYYSVLADDTVSIARCDATAEGHVQIPTEINGAPVTRVGEYAFKDCSKITMAIIPSTVTFVGKSAFYGCTALDTVYISASVKKIEYAAFYNCVSLKTAYIEDVAAWCEADLDGEYANPAAFTGKLTFTDLDITDLKIPANVKKIGQYTFYNCKDIKSVTIPEGVAEIGDCAFYGCSITGTVNMPKSVNSLGERMFYGNEIDGINIPDGNATYKNAGSGVIDVKEKTLIIGFDDTVIPDDGSVTELGGFAFSGCDKMTSITVPDCVTFMEAGVFENCSALTSVTLPKGLQYLNARTFAGCSSLTTVALPLTVERIGISAFRDCTSLNSISLHEGIYEVRDFVFANCKSLTSLDFPSTIEDLGKGITSGCTALTKLNIIDGKSYWGENNCIISEGMLVVGCSTSVIPSDGSVSKIESYTFMDQSTIEAFYIPEEVVNIGQQAFDGCEKFKTVNFSGDKVAWQYVQVASGNDYFNNATIMYKSKAPTVVEGTVDYSEVGGTLDPTETNYNIWIWIAVGAAILIIGSGVATIFIVKSKKKTKDE